MPAPLPPSPPVDLGAVATELAAASEAIGRLDGLGELVPNPALFISMYSRKEAVLSSRIEGTQASLTDLFDDEAGVELDSPQLQEDVREIRNYVRSLETGLKALERLPLSLRLIKQVHAVLLDGVRGQDRTPGEFRRTQNWIGSPGATLQNATFVPPPAGELPDCLSALEQFIVKDRTFPPLIRAGLAHVQFEMIHPFLDGNGRLGRLLITFILCHAGTMRRPLLYLSDYFTRHKQEYYDWLMRVREAGDWEGWLRFYLVGVQEVATEAIHTARIVLELLASHRTLVQERFPNKPNLPRLLDDLTFQPTVNVRRVADRMGVSMPTANVLVHDLVTIGLLREITGRERNRVFRYESYLDAIAHTPRA